VPYFAYARTVGTQLVEVPAMQLGDASAAIGGPSELETEITLYVSMGPLLLRATGIALDADPRPDTELVMRALFAHNLSGRTAPQATDPVPSPIVTPTPRSLPSPTPQPLPTATATPMPTLPLPTVTPLPPTVPPPVPTPLPPQENCDPSYPTVCIPPVWEVGDLDCGDINAGRFTVLPPDPHNFDGPYDGSVPNEPDGIGCEWN
ncbi:MAG TPA: hypothetical protein VK356_03510, partial [Thermomicrobiales bacterium]|nr:hypothetical protein [Thermomicrobiales bacterium]